MNRFENRPGSRPLLPGVLLCCLLIAGCAGRLPPMTDLSATESGAVAAAFAEVQAQARRCGPCFDAEVEAQVSFSNLLGSKSGRLVGYLQAMAPASLKFVAVNPLGQPLFVFVTDGQRFRSLIVLEAREYEGPVQSALFRKYAPPGFEPAEAFAWLSGWPGASAGIVAVRRAVAEEGYWLELHRGSDSAQSYILFEPNSGEVRRHILQDGQGRLTMDVSYDGQAATGAGSAAGCRLPARITVAALPSNGNLILDLKDVLLPETPFGADVFAVESPAGFQKIVVE
ncbi:MAG: hypothetical protein A2521_12495 [Deltaproteobacteria bacterium RIFOXYD12_FULL_57_12]|nr:MAG: hypothetical protein A2521_12495 [Deltaproteobacteria bacterium RIFOXYD12_FULL_57_12]